MAEDGYIQLPTDGAGQRVRTFDNTEYDETTGDQFTVAHEAVTLVDEDADTLTRRRRVNTNNDPLLAEVQMLNRGIAHLILTLISTGRPKGPSTLAADWCNEVLR